VKSSFDEKKIVSQLADPKTCRKAFSLIVEEFSEPLYWMIRHMVLDHDDTNDILQNVFLKAWTNLSDFQYKSKFSTWLYRIAVNESLDFIRKQKTTASISTNNDLSVANKLMADDYFNGEEVQAQLQQAISLLPDVQRTVFNLRYFNEMKYSEMSKLLGTSEGALKASYHLAVKKITEYFNTHD
jgi:RNA polymerase sigma-70 factor (ECF subfamily)